MVFEACRPAAGRAWDAGDNGLPPTRAKVARVDGTRRDRADIERAARADCDPLRLEGVRESDRRREGGLRKSAWYRQDGDSGQQQDQSTHSWFPL